jgi:hypothetical protein
LWSSFDAKARIGGNDDAIEKCCRCFILKDGEWNGVVETVERIERTSFADAQSVDEEKQN